MGNRADLGRGKARRGSSTLPTSAIAGHRLPSSHPDYHRLLNVLAYADTSQEIADKLGVSTRTLRRWKQNGIPEKSRAKQHAKLVSINQYVNKRVKQIEKQTGVHPEPRPLYTIHTSKYDGSRVHYVYVEGASCARIQEILLTLCATQSRITGLPYFAGFYLSIRTFAASEFRWNGDTVTRRGGYVINNNVVNSKYFSIRSFNHRVSDSDYLKELVARYCQPGVMQIIKIGIAATRSKFADEM